MHFVSKNHYVYYNNATPKLSCQFRRNLRLSHPHVRKMWVVHTSAFSQRENSQTDKTASARILIEHLLRKSSSILSICNKYKRHSVSQYFPTKLRMYVNKIHRRINHRVYSFVCTHVHAYDIREFFRIAQIMPVQRRV